MAARRNRRGRRRNRGRFGFLYKLLSFLLIFAAILVGCVVFFRVDTVVVSGQSRYTEEEIIAAAGVKQGDNLFRLNKIQMGADIVRSLPYVDEAAISRKFPDTLLICVTETSAVAAIQSGGEYWLLDARGKLLERGDASLAEGKALIQGLTPLAPAVGTLLAVAAEEQDKLDQLTALLSAIRAEEMTGSLTGFIDLTTANKIRFGYGADLTVVFPMNADFTSKTYALKCTLLKMDEEGVARTGTLDLTYGEDQAHLLPERWLPDQTLVIQPAEPAPEASPEQGDTNQE
ncbi:cell division protein FtsQ/DivIB [Lawsonibacter celer]|uniref:cell division protein FtsQ/DivIB n=1 Tax=Lawsonibacter celer TaxID=2986526 RepID=UPI0016486BC7|nr:FtsQ-type POTRA domain-containing protein [Lawsonibacter celer]